MRLLTSLLLLIFSLQLSAQPNARDIVKKSEEKLRGDHSYSVLSIKIVRPDWTREMKIRAWSEEPDYMMMVIDAPARDKGTVFLKRQKEIWNYLPRIGRSVKLPPSMMGQSWMGSDLNNDDLVRESSIVDDYEYTYLRSEVIRTKKCHVIRLDPKPEAAVVWDHIILFITEDGYFQWQTDFYDENDILINRMESFDIQTIGDRELPLRMKVTPMENPKQYTEMIYEELDFSVVKPDNFYSLQNIQRIR